MHLMHAFCFSCKEHVSRDGDEGGIGQSRNLRPERVPAPRIALWEQRGESHLHDGC